MAMWYFEVCSTLNCDVWRSNTSDTRPKIREGRIAYSDHLGGRVRRVIEVPEKYEHLSLREKRALADRMKWPGGHA